MKNKVTEIVTMKTVDGVSDEKFISIINDLENNFHSQQDGFIDTELLYDSDQDIWIMIQHWNDRASLKAASAMMFKSEETEVYRNSIDPKQISIKIYDTLGWWEN